MPGLIDISSEADPGELGASLLLPLTRICQVEEFLPLIEGCWAYSEYPAEGSRLAREGCQRPPQVESIEATPAPRSWAAFGDLRRDVI